MGIAPIIKQIKYNPVLIPSGLIVRQIGICQTPQINPYTTEETMDEYLF